MTRGARRDQGASSNPKAAAAGTVAARLPRRNDTRLSPSASPCGPPTSPRIVSRLFRPRNFPRGSGLPKLCSPVRGCPARAALLLWCGPGGRPRHRLRGGCEAARGSRGGESKQCASPGAHPVTQAKREGASEEGREEAGGRRQKAEGRVAGGRWQAGRAGQEGWQEGRNGESQAGEYSARAGVTNPHLSPDGGIKVRRGREVMNHSNLMCDLSLRWME